MTEQELQEYITNLEKAGGQTIGPGPGAGAARQEVGERGSRFSQDITAALSPFPDMRPQGNETSLPTMLGIAGGVLPFVAPQLGVSKKIIQAGQAMRAPVMGPSLIGSTFGTAAGTLLEPALTGKEYLTSEFAKQFATNIVENAVWDVGGNLAFTVGGKAFKVAKDTFKNNVPGQSDPRQAVQEWLSNRGATLTKAQLTQLPTDRALEEMAKGGFAGEKFRLQQQNVEKAVNLGMQEVKDTLQTSPSFKLALAADEPFTRAAGENFKELIDIARVEFKDRYRPFYQSLTQNNGVFVDLRGVKAAAQKELDQMAKSKFAGNSAERKTVLDDVLKQDDFVEFGVAHDLRSGFSSSANDLKQPGKATSAKEAAFSKYASEFEKSMDNAILGPGAKQNQIAKDTVNEYQRIKKLYKEGMDGLYNETIAEAMAQSPSKVGQYIADLSESEKFTDLFKAVSVIDEYAKVPGKEGKQILNDVKYSFLEQNLSTPEKAALFARNLTENKDLNSSFYKLFRSEAPALKQVLQAADIGLEGGGSGATYLRNRIVGGASIAGAGALGYFTLSGDTLDRLKNNLPEIALTTGLFILTPRIIARASTSPEAVNALAGLAKASKNPRFTGAAAAKLVDQLNESGIIDSEYITEVNSLFSKTPEPQQPQPDLTPVDFEEYIKSLQGQEQAQ
jgi:hypothetical protein